ncbi:MAG: glutathione S-transferase family protein [Proteobacteria bacterium]|nr:glutathione S-transferase family protein [Pseudomonadota bacterium]
MITLSAFKWVPDFARGQVRDLRVRWACEEAGLPYKTWRIGFDDKETAAYRAWQPFGQVPAMEADGIVMFESGAMVLQIGERSEVLLPGDPKGRARAISWLFCALNTIEVAVQGYGDLFFHKGEDWVAARRPQLVENVQKRLKQLATALGDKDYLEEQFTVGDLMMATVLRILNDDPEFLDAEPALKAYKARCEARPAFQKALKAQLDDFEVR